MKIGVVGSRTFDDYKLLTDTLEALVDNIEVIVSGGANGADKLAAKYAQNKNINLIEFLPQWQLHGRSAGIIRNRSIVQESDMILAFWDGLSKGTANTISRARKAGKTVRVITYAEIENDLKLF